MPEKRGDQIVETTTEARQGESGPSIRNVLMISLLLVIVCFALVYFYFL